MAMSGLRGIWLHTKPYPTEQGKWTCDVEWNGEDRFCESFQISIMAGSEAGCIARAHQVISGLSRVDRDAFKA